MPHNEKLKPYAIEDVEAGKKLPERLSSVERDIEAVEGGRLDTILRDAAQTNEAIASKTDREFYFSGSSGMYLLLNELRAPEPRRQLLMLEQRIAGGKNDVDVTMAKADQCRIMDDLGFDAEAKTKMRGGVEGAPQAMIDIQPSESLPSFPPITVDHEGQKIKVQSPEEMIFDKIRGLNDPGLDQETGEASNREIKWGVDIKLLMTYLKQKNSWSEDQLQKHLSEKWDAYLNEQSDQRINSLVSQKEAGKSNEEILNYAILSTTRQKEIPDTRAGLEKILGSGKEEIIDALLTAQSVEDFRTAIKQALDTSTYRIQDYQAATKKAEEEYQKLLQR
ncbi:hypothetical protein ACFL2B_02780 [Patescibacteria group bacterium]